MTQIKLYSRAFCGWCLDAKDYLKRRKLSFDEVDVGRDAAAEAELISLSGQRYVPTIVVNGQVLANFDMRQLEQFLAKLNV